MKLYGFSPLFYLIAIILALISQKGEACYEPEQEPITIIVTEAI